MVWFKTSGQKKVASFWKWFVKNEDRIYHFDRDTEKIFHELHTEMKRVHEDLAFEFSNPAASGKREFVISAGGIKNAFPVVTALCDAAPALERWRVIPFRQRRREALGVQMGDIKVGPNDITFAYAESESPGKLDVMIYMDAVKSASGPKLGILNQIMYLMLDQTLGEYDVETRLARIDLADNSEEHGLPKLPLAKLAELVDGLPSLRS